MAEYANPHALVSADWVLEHLDDPSVRLVRADRNVDPLESPSIPGSAFWRWDTEMQQPGRHDIPDAPAMEALLARSGISNDTTVVLYGGANSWYATFAYWLLKLYGHEDVRILSGGMAHWQSGDRPTSTDALGAEAGSYRVGSPDFSARALRADVDAAIDDAGSVLVDVRSPPEFNGEVFAPQVPTRFGERAGRIPGAVHAPVAATVHDDGTFRSADELRELFTGRGITPDKAVITYCTLGARSAQSWFVLSELLGYPQARLYDGSWGEWGNLIGARIER